MAFDPQHIYQTLASAPIVPVFFHPDAETTCRIIKACYDGGIRAFEFTNRGENAKEVFKVLRGYISTNYPEMALGIGTVFTALQAQEFIAMGADFVVQPCTSTDVAEVCKAQNIAWMPGAMTVSEVYNATQLGAEIVKIFPGNVVGSGFVKALKGPLPRVKVMVTGGVEPTPESLKEWFGAGVTAVGIGSQLFPKATVEAGNFEEITQKINTLLNFYQTLVTTT
ncbi:bifunctional 4-hydroxy-2-oxoglutarate aldolase/2-dehydro-3-deoxy-phosphogluconate aldolase [Runella slithyformis]|uniref:2-dehydro-3-deoxyphosphogluconate aldolase/4-hydroxy-2-oxoglutarate aldolase n=1 Tax=Runella slithyformis (strain ATCC 29530 / DSM 19594 / LMG 11500 / NCIMB 11436 / LSU 4) TaxID=761193 RepID=A0A7U3ZK89_RUNSL|nr:bifunctional 4-hydroxy-2-oxoglutarate aldolase/2-dehydro-3-deoxy-phosphogluconate aldolase [Runella slithyformis]AEI48697.1 2-dehydro-3-deoxyphosphogluconate aldolase/4-hydroxy-2-oxoglutarate aldolase [Runella slithyformis DSM 19594]